MSTLFTISKVVRIAVVIAILPFLASTVFAQNSGNAATNNAIDTQLETILRSLGFTGRIESTLESRLGRHIDPQLADLGRMLWFDTLTGLNNDNTCGGCHSPTHGFGDTQSIAIGIDNNGVVGPHRSGPRNMRRTPMAINTAFYPKLMWNSRFLALSGDPFNNGNGFQFPLPEGMGLSNQPHLLVAQAFIPPTERTEASGFAVPGDSDALRAEVLSRLNGNPTYRELFGKSFPEVKAGTAISFDMFGRAIAEFEFTLIFADAPIDQFARGKRNAMTEAEKRGALLFFGAANCVACHSVSGQSNEMFSDFQDHVIGVPQIVPLLTNNNFDGLDHNEDFGREQITGNEADRYKFRTSPLRNVALQPTFMHNGAFTNLEDAVRHHLNVFESAHSYSPAQQQIAADLRGATVPIDPVLAHLDPLLATPILLTDKEFAHLVAFVRNGLLDPRAAPENLRKLIPRTLPSANPPLVFEFD